MVGSGFFSSAEPDPDPRKKMLDPHPCKYHFPQGGFFFHIKAYIEKAFLKSKISQIVI